MKSLQRINQICKVIREKPWRGVVVESSFTKFPPSHSYVSFISLGAPEEDVSSLEQHRTPAFWRPFVGLEPWQLSTPHEQRGTRGWSTWSQGVLKKCEREAASVALSVTIPDPTESAQTSC